MSRKDVNERYRVWCKKCGREMVPTEIRTVADKAVVELIHDNVNAGIAIYRCTEGHRVFLIADNEDSVYEYTEEKKDDRKAKTVL